MIQIILLPRLLQANFNFITPTIMKPKIYLVLLGLLVICLNTVAQTYSIEVTNGKAFKVRGASLVEVTQAEADEEIKLIAVAPNPEFEEFYLWRPMSGNVVFADANEVYTSFTMPAENVSVGATYKIVNVTATSDYKDIITYGSELKEPTFTVADGCNAQFSKWTYTYQKQSEEGNWKEYSGRTFDAGVYRLCVLVRTDGDYYKLKQFSTVVINGTEWTDKTSFSQGPDYSEFVVYSPNITITDPFPRTEIATVTATSNIADIIGDDKECRRPDFTITTSEGAEPYISSARWMKKTEADEWVNYKETTFTPGIYRMDIQMDMWNKTYKLATDWSLTIDGVAWETEPAKVIDEKSSYGCAHSPEFIIKKEVTAVSATSDIMDIIGYAKQRKTPKFTMSEGSLAYIPLWMTKWQKKNEDNTWDDYDQTIFTEGTYRVVAQVRVEVEYYKLSADFTLTIDGKEWTHDTPTIREDYSYSYGYSPEIVVSKPVSHPITVVNGKAYIGEGDEKIEVTEAKQDTYITVIADEPAPGMRFKEWVVECDKSTSVIYYNHSTASMRMPDAPVKITATYREEGTLIHNVTLTGLCRPVIGEKPATEDISLGENVDLAAYWLVYSEESDDYVFADADSPFESDKKYAVRIDARAVDGYDFAYDVKVFFNGKEVPERDLENPAQTMFKDNYEGWLIIGILADEMPEIQYIDDLTISGFTYPQPGQILADPDEISVSDENVEVDESFWVKFDKITGWTDLFDDTKPVEEGQKYAMQINLKAVTGYTFASDLKIRIGEKTIPILDIKNPPEEECSIAEIEGNMAYVFVLMENMPTTGIDDVNADTFGPVDVYNLQGILVKRNISREDIKYLPTGIYIVAGKKILVK